MADRLFEHPRLARIYDDLDTDRSDLDVYIALVRELEATTVLDVGCGTGTLACALADQGVVVTAVDPAGASLAVAQAKPGADRVRWVQGTVESLPAMHCDLALMTGNVAQVFVDDEAWRATLRGIAQRLHPGGQLVFETRDPADMAWTRWDRSSSSSSTYVPGVGVVESWVELVRVVPGSVSFRWTFEFPDDGAVLTSTSTLRFREREELRQDLDAAGFVVRDLRDAPDRPGRELVFIASRTA